MTIGSDRVFEDPKNRHFKINMNRLFFYVFCVVEVEEKFLTKDEKVFYPLHPCVGFSKMLWS